MSKIGNYVLNEIEGREDAGIWQQIQEASEALEVTLKTPRVNSLVKFELDGAVRGIVQRDVFEATGKIIEVLTGQILAETEKAYKIDVTDGIIRWIPKSRITILEVVRW